MNTLTLTMTSACSIHVKRLILANELGDSATDCHGGTN